MSVDVDLPESPTSEALDRLKAAAIVIADILDAGERDPRWAESQELEAAAIEYGRATRQERILVGKPQR